MHTDSGGSKLLPNPSRGAAVAARPISSHLLKLCRPWCCTRDSWGWGAWGRARLGMGWSGGWGEEGGVGEECWGERGRGLNSWRAFLSVGRDLWRGEGRPKAASLFYLLHLPSILFLSFLNQRADWLGKRWSDWLSLFLTSDAHREAGFGEGDANGTQWRAEVLVK